MSEFIVFNGHAPWCAYIRSLGYLVNDEEPCDCVGWDDNDADSSDYYVDGDTDW